MHTLDTISPRPFAHRFWRQAGCLSVLLLAVQPSALHADEAVARRWTPPTLASDQYESSPTFTPDGSALFFMRSDKNFRNYRILWSRCENGAWTPPEEAPFAAPRPALEADPFVTADGKRLYYVSSRHDAVNQDLDIWFVDRKPGGGWATPQRLPAPVNSSESELLPRQAADGRLYFGSSRAGGHGQGDIYVAIPMSRGRWRVNNVGPPISTTANEYEATLSDDGKTMVVVADRGDRSHLYRYVLRGGRWIEQERIPAAASEFQVGPLLSSKGDRLLFAQKDGDRSGELFLVDLVEGASSDWPPRCGDSKVWD